MGDNWGQYLGQMQGMYPQQIGQAIPGAAVPSVAFNGWQQVKPKEKGMFKSLREYVEKHSDVIWTIVTILLLDHFLFEGKFKAKIEDIMENLVSKASDRVKKLDEK